MSASTLMFLGALHVKAAIFMTLVLGIVYATRRTSSGNRYLVMRMTLSVVAVVPLLMLALPSILIPLDLWRLHPMESATIVLPANAGDDSAAAIADLPFSMEALLLAGYLSISALLLLRVVIGFLRTRTDIRRCPRIDCPPVTSLFDQIRRRLDMKTTVVLVTDSSGVGPYVWGINKQVIAVPKEFLTAAPDIQRTVLTHELIHVVRRDTLVCMASRILCCLYWINPVMWLLNARLQSEMEQSCDERAVRTGINAADYADHLLKVIQLIDVTQRPGSAVAMARASSIKHRIRSLLSGHRQRGVMSTSRSVGVFSTLLLAGMSLGALSATDAPSYQASQKALIAAVNRLVPEGCETEEVRFLSPESVEITGSCASASRIAAFMRNLDRAVGKPDLQEVRTSATGGSNSFKLRLYNPQAFAPK